MTRPRYVEQVASRPSPQVDLQVTPSPAAFGAVAGQAFADMGQALGKVAGAAIEIEELTNETLAREAAIRYSRAAAELLHGQDGYLQLTGTAALGRRADYQRRLEELRVETGRALPSGARRFYDRFTEPRSLAYYEHLVRHEADQLRAATNASLSAAVANSTEDAVRARHNRELFAWHLEEAVRSFDRFAELNGLPPEQRDLKRREVVSSVYLQAIMAAADEPGGAVAAAALAREAEAHLTAADRAQLDRVLGPTLRRGRAAAFLAQFARSPSAAYHTGGPQAGRADAVARLLGEAYDLPAGSPAAAGAVYDEFRRQGFPPHVARALAAEVYRETGFDPRYLFGEHLDPKNAATNAGLFSWQGERRDKLLAWLRERGHLDDKGRIIPSRDALRAQVEFVVAELDARPDAAEFRRRLAEAKTDDELAELLGRDYIKWAIDDPKYREAGLRAIRRGRELVDLAANPQLLGVEPTPENRFLLERFGPTNGAALISAHPGEPVERVLGMAEAERRGLAGLTAGHVRRRVAELFGAPSAPMGRLRTYDYAAAARAVDQIDDPELRQAAWEELVARYQRDTFAAQQDRQDMLDNIWKQIVDKGEVKLSAAQMLQLGADGVEAVNKLVVLSREGVPASDMHIYSKLYTMAAEEPDKFLSVDLFEHLSRGHLSNRDYRDLRDLQVRLRAGAEAQQRELESRIQASAALGRVRAFATQTLGFDPLGTDEKDKRHYANARLFQIEFAKLFRAETLRAKRDLVEDELMQLVTRLTAPVRTSTGEWPAYLADYKRQPGDQVAMAPLPAEHFPATTIETVLSALAQVEPDPSVDRAAFVSHASAVRHANNLRLVRDLLDRNPSPTVEDLARLAPSLDVDPTVDLPRGLFTSVPDSSFYKRFFDSILSKIVPNAVDEPIYAYVDEKGDVVTLKGSQAIERLKMFWMLFYVRAIAGGAL